MEDCTPHYNNNRDYYVDYQLALAHVALEIGHLTSTSGQERRFGWYAADKENAYPIPRPPAPPADESPDQRLTRLERTIPDEAFGSAAELALTSLRTFMIRRFPRLRSASETHFNLATTPAIVVARKSVHVDSTGRYDLSHVTLTSDHEDTMVPPSMFRRTNVYVARHMTGKGQYDTVSLMRFNNEAAIVSAERWRFSNPGGLRHADGVSSYPPPGMLGDLADRLNNLSDDSAA